MENEYSKTENAAELRRRAEELVLSNAGQQQEDIEALLPDSFKKTLHSLCVHQVELEMQNEDLRRAQMELDAARARYFDLYDLAPVGYITLTESGLIQEANLMAATLLGSPRVALTRNSISHFILKDDQDSYYLRRKRLFETAEPQAWELRMVKQDGTAFWAHLQTTIAEGEGGARVCRCVLSDITHLKQAEAILKRAKEDAEIASKAKSEFLNNIAHDFRTPMHAIMGLSTFFQTENATANQKKYANIINEKSKGLLVLIEELLDVSRLDAGKLKLRAIEFDLKEAVLEAVNAGRTELTAQEVTLTCSVEEGLARVNGDKIRFSQILNNLIGNAIKYTDKGEIIVSVVRQPENCSGDKCRVRVSVKDTGLGIPGSKQELIFDAYTRFQEFNGTRERGGVGLGLYITKTLVELMGGTVRVVSEVGVGSEFVVVLDFDIAGTGK